MGRGQFMSDSRHENESGLIIEPALLADIQAACRRRAAELETATSAESRLSSELFRQSCRSFLWIEGKP